MIPYFKAYLIKHEKIVDVREINYNLLEIGWRDDDFHDTVSSFDDIKFIQSSGLTDYHYREYCEGDIARDVTSEKIGVVEYLEGAFVMRFTGGNSVDLCDVKDEFEIIGNKFEDGYLLEED